MGSGRRKGGPAVSRGQVTPLSPPKSLALTSLPGNKMFIYYKVSCSGGSSLPKNLNFVTKITVLQDTESTNHFRDVSKEKGRGSRDDRKKGLGM